MVEPLDALPLEVRVFPSLSADGRPQASAPLLVMSGPQVLSYCSEHTLPDLEGDAESVRATLAGAQGWLLSCPPNSCEPAVQCALALASYVSRGSAPPALIFVPPDLDPLRPLLQRSKARKLRRRRLRELATALIQEVDSLPHSERNLDAALTTQERRALGAMFGARRRIEASGARRADQALSAMHDFVLLDFGAQPRLLWRRGVSIRSLPLLASYVNFRRCEAGPAPLLAKSAVQGRFQRAAAHVWCERDAADADRVLEEALQQLRGVQWT
jgi:hypothetical protein